MASDVRLSVCVSGRRRLNLAPIGLKLCRNITWARGLHLRFPYLESDNMVMLITGSFFVINSVSRTSRACREPILGAYT